MNCGTFAQDYPCTSPRQGQRHPPTRPPPASKRQALIEDPHTLAVFVSPSRDGLKALVGTTATDQRSHYEAYATAGRYLVSKGFEADAVCKGPGAAVLFIVGPRGMG